MHKIDITLPCPQANLQLDEQLLDRVEGARTGPVLRFWQPSTPFVVLGYGNREEQEVHVSECKDAQIPIYRRCSGGGTILQTAGCLNYSLILPIKYSPELQTVTTTNNFVMEKQRLACAKVSCMQIRVEGTTDLTCNGLKFSGNAQRRRRLTVLFHGCLLLSADIQLIGSTLKQPSRSPEYRRGRAHEDFLCNLKVSSDSLKNAISLVWQASIVPETAEAIKDLLPITNGKT